MQEEVYNSFNKKVWSKSIAPNIFKYAKDNLSKSYMEADSRRLSNNKKTRAFCFYLYFISFFKCNRMKKGEKKPNSKINQIQR